MDNGKVNGLNVPPPAHSTGGQQTRANPLAMDRFSRAIGDDRGMIRGTPISDPTRERAQENRQYGYRRFSGTIADGAMDALAKDMVASSGAVLSRFDDAAPARATAGSSTAANAELAQMLERMCSALYVGDKSAGTQRVVMALDHVLPGAAAEIVREGVHLSIRLHARTGEAYRSMASQRDALMRSLGSSGERRVEVSVVHGADKILGDGHG